MTWLIGLLCIVIIVAFWRVFLPLALIAIMGIIFLFWIMVQDGKERGQDKQKEVEMLHTKIKNAQLSASAEGKEWKLLYEPDPASDIPIARTASILSNDGLCALTVQQRLNGAKLTGLVCPDITINHFSKLEVKFDTLNISQKMRLEKYKDNNTGVYIPPYQYLGDLDYDSFIRNMTESNSLALKVPGHEEFWTKFSLKGAQQTLAQLGKEQAGENFGHNHQEGTVAIEVELHDGRVLEFPHGTDPAIIQHTVKEMLDNGRDERQLNASETSVIATENVEVDNMGLTKEEELELLQLEREEAMRKNGAIGAE